VVAHVWKVKDRVRLVRDVGGLPAGSEGAILGFVRRPEADEVAAAFADRTLILGTDVEPVVPGSPPPDSS
jgi:hypothetical protein